MGYRKTKKIQPRTRQEDIKLSGGDNGRARRRSDVQELQSSAELSCGYRAEWSAGWEMLWRTSREYTWSFLRMFWFRGDRRRSILETAACIFGFGIVLGTASGLMTLAIHIIGLIWQVAIKS